MKRFVLISIAAVCALVLVVYLYGAVMDSRHAAANIKADWDKYNAEKQLENDELQVANDKLDIDIARLEHKPPKVLKKAIDKLALDQTVVAADKIIVENSAR